MKPQKETDLVKAILVWLRSAKSYGCWWRSNTGAVVSEYKGRKRFTRFGVPGMSDICGVLDGGRAVFIECKSPKGKLSDAQKAFGESVKSAGAIYIVARSIGDVEAGLC